MQAAVFSQALTNKMIPVLPNYRGISPYIDASLLLSYDGGLKSTSIFEAAPAGYLTEQRGDGSIASYGMMCCY